ncbi:MAG: hypothetical protein JWN15_1203 [Firmicutes bacterium]|nr:hypothetical protein [Bacillota bacterium]
MEPATRNDSPDEGALIAAAKRDPAAFGVLYQRHAQRIYQYLRYRSGAAEDAEELTAQTFLRALEYLPRYQWNGAPFVTWLYRIANSLLVSQRRRPSPTALPDDRLYPPDPVSTSVSGTGADIDVDFTSAKGSPLAAADDLPGIHVWIRSGKIFQASGMWPKSSSPAGDVPLRTAREAWADLQAGTGAVVGTVGRVNAELQSHMTIHSVSLDRVLVRSLENRWYYIPVVLFEGEIKDTKGQGHKAIAYVTAVKPTPGQGGYELKAALPQAPAQLPSVQISKRWAGSETDRRTGTDVVSHRDLCLSAGELERTACDPHVGRSAATAGRMDSVWPGWAHPLRDNSRVGCQGCGRPGAFNQP